MSHFITVLSVSVVCLQRSACSQTFPCERPPVRIHIQLAHSAHLSLQTTSHTCNGCCFRVLRKMYIIIHPYIFNTHFFLNSGSQRHLAGIKSILFLDAEILLLHASARLCPMCASAWFTHMLWGFCAPACLCALMPLHCLAFSFSPSCPNTGLC